MTDEQQVTYRDQRNQSDQSFFEGGYDLGIRPEAATCTARVPSVKQLQPVKTFDALFAELSERAKTRPAGSGTVAALDAGVHHLGKKIIEEAGEVWIAAEHESDDELAGEISQLLYWTQVLMIKRGLTLDDVYGKL